ncbi:stalk domain-containing protein [Paenibacillus larvae]|uniref:Copper amine oxidase-like protein n=1 Tax=Paenibacillus larvae subsp. larvae TaxID=147375 RepID=A0A6C0QZQ4_9BACL|nr:copper amine oxidase N-terminal domain-containing protein [Paenibacillus larvae]QHZ54162.1 copper amine oxidase-like protein [Paenibacillus larvae subsp. larvae]
MKKVMLCVLAAANITLGLGVTGAKAAPNEISVKLNDKPLTFDVQPTTIDGRTYVPVAKILEEMGAQVKWNQDTWTVTAEKDDVTITMPIGDSEIEVDDQKLDIGLPSKIERGRTLVPLRLVSYATGTKIEWDDEDQTVLLTQSTEELVNQFVSGKVDDPVTYEHSKVLFDWILKEDQKGHLEPFYGNRAPEFHPWTGKPFKYNPGITSWFGYKEWENNLNTKYDCRVFTSNSITKEIWTDGYLLTEHKIVGTDLSGDVLFTDFAYSVTDQTVKNGIFSWMGKNVRTYLPSI